METEQKPEIPAKKMPDNGEVTKKSRTLVLCFDGTANEYDADNTNVVKFFALLKKDDFNEQLTYYQAGIGTWFNPGIVAPAFRWAAKILDYAFAVYLDAHVIDGYRFLMQNYRVGDKICIFGFSRGAYTARALAGTLYKVGLLPRENQEQIPFAYKLYKREDKEGIELCAGFKQTFCQDVKVEFMGVWDTVASVGVVMGRSLPFTNSNSSIKTFRHALSLDERRVKFQPNRWHRSAPNESAAALDPEHGSKVTGPSGISNLSPISIAASDTTMLVGSPKKRAGKKLWKFRRYDSGSSENGSDDDNETDVLEVWFSGCHSDVGGGADLNSDSQTLSNISLRWMVRQVISSQCGIQFDRAALARASIPLLAYPPGASSPPQSPDGTITNGPRSPLPSQEEIVLDGGDALEPLHDSLKATPLWWLLEIVPLKRSWQDDKGVWHSKFRINFGRGRTIVDKNPLFHFTVKQRMEAAALKYKPKAKFETGNEMYVQ